MKWKSRWQRLADIRRKRYTSAERELEEALCNFDNGYFIGKFQREWVLAGRFRLDFFFYEARLGVELDGGYHSKLTQRKRDKKKELECNKHDVLLLRFSNADALNNMSLVIKKIVFEYQLRIQEKLDVVD